MKLMHDCSGNESMMVVKGVKVWCLDCGRSYCWCTSAIWGLRCDLCGGVREFQGVESCLLLWEEW